MLLVHQPSEVLHHHHRPPAPLHTTHLSQNPSNLLSSTHFHHSLKFPPHSQPFLTFILKIHHILSNFHYHNLQIINSLYYSCITNTPTLQNLILFKFTPKIFRLRRALRARPPAEEPWAGAFRKHSAP